MIDDGTDALFALTRMLTRHHPSHEVDTDIPKPTGPFYNLACLCIGAPACGMNAAVRSFVRNAILNGHKPLGVNNGFDGLINNDIFEIGWGDVTGWVGLGGALLGQAFKNTLCFVPALS